MKAAVVEQFKKPLTIRNDWPDPQIGPDDAVVRVVANGICRSDWLIWQGHWDWMGINFPLPMVLGHESAGIVEEVGANVRRFKKGDRVVFPSTRRVAIVVSVHPVINTSATTFPFPWRWVPVGLRRTPPLRTPT